MKIAIIGAGVSGLAAAKCLSSQHQVILFDKGRGLGGRLTTRRFEHTAADIGAQYFTARDPDFVQQCQQWLQQGIIAPWHGELGSWQDGQLEPLARSQLRYVATPGMSQLATAMAAGLQIERSSEVGQVQWLPQTRQWQLQFANQRARPCFDALIMSCPPRQTQQLLATDVLAQSLAAQPPMLPCFTFVMAFAEPIRCRFDGLFVNNHPVSWLARDSSKPGRMTELDTWVMQLSPEASLERLDDNADALLPQAQAWLAELLDQPRLARPQLLNSHRWLYARPQPSQQDLEQTLHRWYPEQRLALVGDWLAGGRVEGAWLSGRTAGLSLLRTATAPS